MSQPANARFGAYEILHELRSGGMGSVLLGRRRGPGTFEQIVAIKTIRAEHASSPTIRAMFLDEAAILARIHHPGIASVHDFGEENGTLYMVMEYVAGISLRDVESHKPPPIVVARAIAEACRGLHAAHELRDHAGALLGLVHRDISPDNIMVGFDGHVKVIDFGIALIKNRQAPVTELGSVKGKPPYMSPEHVRNEALDRRSDVFSLAVVMWELLAGKPLFEGDSIYAIAFAVQEQPIPPPSQLAGMLPTGLDAAIMAALERDPARRTPTAAAFAEQLETVIQSSGGPTLESWAERELARARDDHRQWLARILHGESLPKAVGRATGQATQIADLEVAKTPPAAPPPPVTEEATLVPAKRSKAPLAIVLLALLVAGVAGFLATRRRRQTAVTPTSRDAAIAAIDADAALVVDAELRDSMPVDAAASVDAALRIHADAGTRHSSRDAAVAVLPPKPDAALAAPPSGTGTVTLRYKPGVYANISIDSGPPQPGPIINRKLPSGRHTITFLDPKSGDVLDSQTITLDPGAHADVVQR